MATYTLTDGTDAIIGTTGNDTFDVPDLAALSSSDTINGRIGTDTMVFETAGAITGAQFSGVYGIEDIVLADGTNSIILSNHMLSQVSPGDTLDVSSADSTGTTTFSLRYVTTGAVDLTGGAGNDIFYLSAALFNSDPDIAISGGGGTNTLHLTGGGTVDLAQDTDITGITAVRLDNADYTLTLGKSGTAVYMGGDADTLAIGPATGSATFHLGAAGQTAEGGSGNDTFVITAAIDAYGPDGETTINGGGGANNVLSLQGGGTFDLGLLDISNVQTIKIGNAATTLEVSCADAASYNITAGNGSDTFDLTNFGCTTRLTAGNGNDTVYIGSASQIIDLGGGTNTVWVTPDTICRTSIVNGGSGADNTLIITCGACEDAVLGRHVTGFATVDLDFLQNGDLWANTSDALTVSGTELGGDRVVLYSAGQSYIGDEATGFLFGPPCYLNNTVVLHGGSIDAGVTLDGGADSNIGCYNTLTLADSGTYDFGTSAGATSALVQNFGNINVLCTDTILTLNDLSGVACDNGGYTVNISDHSGASLDDALTGGSGDNTFVLLGPNSCATTVEMTGSLDGGVGGTNVLDVCSGAWDLSGTTLSNIADIDISGGASLTLSSLQITDLAAQPGGISFYDSPGGTLVIDVAPGQHDFNLASLDLNFHGLQVDIVANSLGDTIWGGSQGETIVGGTGGSGDNDFIHAGSGDDTIIAGTGTNTVIYTGDGNDTVVFGAYGSTATQDIVVTASVPLATGSVLFDSNPTNNSTVDLDGTTITFVSSDPTGNEVLIGASLSDTLSSLQTFLQHDTHLQSATYSISGGNTLEITAANSYTLPTDGTVSDSTTAGTDSTPIAANPTTGTVTLTTPPVVGDTVTIDGVTFTFVSGTSEAFNQVQIGDLQQTFIDLYDAVSGASATAAYGDGAAVTFTSLGDTIYVNDATGTGSSLSPLLTTSDSNLIVVKEQDGSLASSTAATYATGEFCFSGNPAAGEQVSIGATEYTFVTELTGASDQVLIGSSLDATLANFLCVAEETYGSSLSFEISGSDVLITADNAGSCGTFTLDTTNPDVVSSVSGLTLTGGVCTDILVDSGSVAEDVVYVGHHQYDVPVYSPDIVDFTKAELLYQTGGTLTIDANAIAIVTDTQTQAFHLSGTVVQGAGGDGAPAGVLEIIASGLNEALTLNDAGLFGSTTTLAYTNSDCSPIVLVDDVSNVSLPTTITVDTDVANNVEIYVGTFVNATTGIVSTNNAALECNGSYGATGAGTFTPLAATVTVTLNGTGNQTVWVGSGLDTVLGNGNPDSTGSDFFVFDVSATNAPAAVETAATANVAESSYAALAGATYFFTSDVLVGNPDACSPNQIDVLANTDFTNAVVTYEVSSSSYEYAAIGNANQVYIADGVDATFDSWQLDNSNGVSYSSEQTGIDNYSNIGGNCGPVTVYGENGTAGYFDPTTHSWVAPVIAHSYLTINVTTPDTGSMPPDGPALDLTNIYVVPGSYGEVDITINDTYSQANTIEIVDGSVSAIGTAEVSPLIVNSFGTDQTFLFDNCGGCGYFNPTDTFNGDVSTTLDVESYVTASVICADIAGVPQINLEGSVPGEANFTCATISDISYFVIGAANDTVNGETANVEGAGSLTGSTSYADTLAQGPAVAEFVSPQIDNSTVFIGCDSAMVVDVNETNLNSASQEVFALGTNGEIHISVATNVALYFTDQSNGSGYAVVRGEADFAANGATGYFIVGGATYGYGTEFLLGSSGVDSIYAGVGTTDTVVSAATGLNTILDGEGGTGTHTGFNGASDVQVSTDLLQGASMGLATFLFDTNDVTNPDLSCGPNVEALTCSTAGFAVTDDTISAYANTDTNDDGTPGLTPTSSFSQIDVAANTDFYGATFDLKGVAGTEALASDPVVIFIESGVAAVFSDTEIAQFASDTVIIQDGGCGGANLVIDLNVHGGTEDMGANLAAVLPDISYDVGVGGEQTQWNVCSDTLTIVTNAAGSTFLASDLPGVDSGTLYLDGQGGNDTFVFNNAHSQFTFASPDPDISAGVASAIPAYTVYGATDAYINGGGGNNVIDIDMKAPASGINVYDFSCATIANIETINFAASDTMAVFSGDQLSGTTIALVDNDVTAGFNLLDVVGHGDIDLSHLNVTSWVGSLSEIIVDDTGAGTNSVTVLASGGSDEILVNGYGDTIQAGNGPDLADFLNPNAANNFVFPASNLSPLTGAAGAQLGTVADLVEGFNAPGSTPGTVVGYTGATNTISSTAIDPYGYLDLQGFSVSTSVDVHAVSAGADLSSLTAYGVIEDSTLVSTNFTNGATGISDRVVDGGIATALTAIEGLTAAQGQEFLLVMYADSKTGGGEDAAVFLVHHTGVTGHIAAGDIQVLGVIDHAVAAGSLLPANFFHLHA